MRGRRRFVIWSYNEEVIKVWSLSNFIICKKYRISFMKMDGPDLMKEEMDGFDVKERK